MEASPRRDTRKRPEYPDSDCISKSSTKWHCPSCFVCSQRDTPHFAPNKNSGWNCFRMPFCNFQFENVLSPALISPQLSCRRCCSSLHDNETEDQLHSCTPYTLSALETFQSESHVYCGVDDMSVLSNDGDHTLSSQHVDCSKYVSLKALFWEQRLETPMTDESTRS
jgi:hypothetical protein